LEAASPWLTTSAVLAAFSRNRLQARERYRRFVQEGIGAASIWSGLNRQVFLGDDGFVERMQRRIDGAKDDVQIPKLQRRAPAPTLAELAERAESRNEAIVAAHATGAYSYSEIGAFFGLHFATIGKIVRKAAQQRL
jgi:DNA-directed RNA polymerase specialized sigma24 family protein